MLFNVFQVVVLYGIEPMVEFESFTRLPNTNKMAYIVLINVLFTIFVLLIVYIDNLHFQALFSKSSGEEVVVYKESYL